MFCEIQQLAAKAKITIPDFYVIKDYMQSKYNIPKERKPDSHIMTIERIIKCDLEIVYNVLVDSHQIEKTMLAETRQAAEKLFHQGGGHFMMPRNVNQAYDIEGSKTVVRSSSLAFQFNRFGKQPVRYLSKVSASETQIIEETQRLECLQREHKQGCKERNQIETKIEDTESKYHILKSDLIKLDKELSKVNHSLPKLERQLAKVQTEMNKQVNESTAEDEKEDIAIFETEFLESQREITQSITTEDSTVTEKMNRIASVKITIDNLKNNLKPIEQKLEDVKVDIDTKVNEQKEGRHGMDELLERRSKIQTSIARKTEKLQKIRDINSEITKKVKDTEDDYIQAKLLALKVK